MTTGGVSSGIDLALYIVENEVSAEAAAAEAEEIEWTWATR